MTIRMPALIPALFHYGRRVAAQPMPALDTGKPHDFVTMAAAALAVLVVALVAVLLGMT
jgi:hypothetical protein